MAARYGSSSFARSARSAFNSFRNSTSSSASQSSRTPRGTRNAFENGSPSMNRRRVAETIIPLHNVVASAKLVSHLSVSSRRCRTLCSGLQGYFFSSMDLCKTQCLRGTWNLSIKMNAVEIEQFKETTNYQVLLSGKGRQFKGCLVQGIINDITKKNWFWKI